MARNCFIAAGRVQSKEGVSSLLAPRRARGRGSEGRPMADGAGWRAIGLHGRHNVNESYVVPTQHKM
jgi:hypothetical protein